MTRAPKAIPLICALFAVFAAQAGAAEHSKNPALDAYAKPGELVDIGAGRHLNLRCAGSGSATVVLESGNLADSMAWFKVQPGIAAFARVCAYDRAGMGFSDGGPLPRNLDANAADLAALIGAAHLATPVVLVGHSYGTNVVRRVAELHPADVAALVLLDPPPQHVAEFSKEFDTADDADRAAGEVVMRQCEQGARAAQLDTPPPALKVCLRGPNPDYSDVLNAAQHASKIRPAFWQTIISTSESNGALYKQPVAKSESHGAMPLFILQPDAPFGDAPPEVRKPLEAARQKTHNAIAATSTRGIIIPVAKSSHDVQIDQPAAVVKIVRAAIDQSKPVPARNNAAE